MPLFLPSMPLVVHIMRPTMVMALGKNYNGNPLRHTIRVTTIAVQEKSISLSHGCTLPPTPFIPSVTLLHHAPPNLAKFIRS